MKRNRPDNLYTDQPEQIGKGAGRDDLHADQPEYIGNGAGQDDDDKDRADVADHKYKDSSSVEAVFDLCFLHW